MCDERLTPVAGVQFKSSANGLRSNASTVVACEELSRDHTLPKDLVRLRSRIDARTCTPLELSPRLMMPLAIRRELSLRPVGALLAGQRSVWGWQPGLPMPGDLVLFIRCRADLKMSGLQPNSVLQGTAELPPQQMP